MQKSKIENKKPHWTYRVIVVSVLSMVLFITSGCLNVDSVNNLKGVERLPRPTQTFISDHLACISDMISEYRFALEDGNPQPIRIAIPYVKDKTNISSRDYPESEIPNDMTDMALGIASRIGGPIRLIHVPSTNEILDAARVTGKPESEQYFDGFNFSHYKPNTLILYGALTEYDRITSAREKTLDGDFEFGGGETETTVEFSKLNGKTQARMTMDFRVIHPAVGDVVNHASSTNTVELFMMAKDRSYGISVNGNSIGFAKAYTDVEARHQAIRMLIEMGIIESIAKFFYVPYWKCYPGVEKATPVNFADYFNTPDDLHFDPLNLQTESVSEPDPQPQKNEDEVEEAAIVDYRDSELIRSLLFYYNYDEFLHNFTRYHVKRKSLDNQVNVAKITFSVEGKKTKLRKILSLYRKNLPAFSNSGDQVIYTRMYKYFLERLMIKKQDTDQEQRMFLGLWLNAPIKMDARWNYL